MPFTEYSRLITINEIDDLKKDLKTKGKSIKICGMFLWLLQNKHLLFCTALRGHNERREEG